MPKIMLINVTHPEESRVGIVDNGVLESFEIESTAREHLKGNIYKGVVHRIHPALEAAFVDIGADRDAFLPLDEICFRNLRNNGQIQDRRPRIRDILKPGQELLVQIVKDEFGQKPPTLTTFYSLPGRYLVLLPGSDETGISRKIEGEERQRVRELVEQLNPPEGFGIIVRTAAGFDEESKELERDLVYLQRLWESILRSSDTQRGPGLVYREHDLVMRNIRDYFTPDIDEIYIDNEEVFQRARDFLHNVMPGKERVLHLFDSDKPLFSHFNVEAEIESIFKRRVPLRSGGSIVIDGTEALTAIDVNSGGSVRGASQEETAFKTNLEAAAEAARQLRLRDLGGLIVIDFIDMRQTQHNQEVERVLRDAMKPDKARHDIGRISRFGLLEISRQRLRPAAAAASYTSCPMCEGHGLVRTTESAALVALRKVHNRIAHGDVAWIRLTVRPEIAVYLLNQKREDLALLESRYGVRLQVNMSEKLMPHQSEFEIRPRLETERPQAAPKPGEVVAIAPKVAEAAGTNGAAPEAADGTKKKRRRRRGRGRGKQAAQALAEALSALGSQTGLVVDAASSGVPSVPVADAGGVPASVPSRRVAGEREARHTETTRDRDFEPKPVVSIDGEEDDVAAEGSGSTAQPATEASAPGAPAARGSRRGRGGRSNAAARQRSTARTSAKKPAAKSRRASGEKAAEPARPKKTKASNRTEAGRSKARAAADAANGSEAPREPRKRGRRGSGSGASRSRRKPEADQVAPE